MKANSFVLSVISPVLYKSAYDARKGNSGKSLKIVLDDVDEVPFKKLLALACGQSGIEVRDLMETMVLGKLAIRFVMPELVNEVEDLVLAHMRLENCAELLCASRNSGLGRVESSCRKMILAQFEEVAKTGGFMAMDEDTLCSVLQDDALTAREEDSVFEAVVGWMMREEAALRGEALLEKIRFPPLSLESLKKHSEEAIPGNAHLKDLLVGDLMQELAGFEHSVIGVTGACEMPRRDRRALAPRSHRDNGSGPAVVKAWLG